MIMFYLNIQRFEGNECMDDDMLHKTFSSLEEVNALIMITFYLKHSAV